MCLCVYLWAEKMFNKQLETKQEKKSNKCSSSLHTGNRQKTEGKLSHYTRSRFNNKKRKNKNTHTLPIWVLSMKD